MEKKVLLDKLPPGTRFMISGETREDAWGDIYMKLDQRIDNKNFKISYNSRWPDYDYNVINTRTGRLMALRDWTTYVWPIA